MLAFPKRGTKKKEAAMEEKNLQTTVTMINDRAKFSCTATGNKEPVIVDYIPPLGDGEGYTSLELLLISLATCFGSTIKFILTGQLNKSIHGLTVRASGTRREEHPTTFESVRLALAFHSPDTTLKEVEEVITLAKTTYCPVWAALNPEIPIETTVTIEP